MVQPILHQNLEVWVTSMSDDLRKASEVFTLVQSISEIKKLIIAYHVYYDYYKIDRNKHSRH
jgi:hypothetical protein